MSRLPSAPFPMLFALAATMVNVPALAAQEPAWGQATPPMQEVTRPWLLADRPVSLTRGEPNEAEEFETDRDSFTPATTLAGRGRLIFEAAYSLIDNRHGFEAHSFPEALFRIGLTDWLELRLGANYEVGGGSSMVPLSRGEPNLETAAGGGSELERESRVSYGVKLRTSEADGLMPGSALILQGQTPTSGPSTKSHFLVTYVFGWELTSRCTLDAAARYGTESEAEDHFSILAPSVVLKYALTERINVHAEYFSLISRGKERESQTHFLSPGIHYLLARDVEIGVRGGWGLNDQTPRYFINAGIGLRF